MSQGRVVSSVLVMVFLSGTFPDLATGAQVVALIAGRSPLT